MEEIIKNCVETSVPEQIINEPDSSANSPPKIIKKMFVLDPGKLKALGLDAKIKSALAKKKKTVTKKDQQQTTSTNFIEKKIPDKNKEIKIISDVNLEDPMKLDLVSSYSKSTNLIKGFSETNTVIPKIEIKAEDVVDPLKSSNLYRVLPESSKSPQNMIYKTTDKNNKETVYKIYLTSISKKSTNNNDSSPDKPDLAVKKSIPNQPELQKKIIENFNKVFANTPVKFNETVDTDNNTKTSTPNCLIYKSQGGTLTPIKMVCKTPRVSSVKIISKNSPEIKNHGSFSKIDISKLKAKLNENLRKMSGTTPERKIIEKSPSSLVKEYNKSPKTSIENVPSDAMNRLNEYLKKIQDEKKLNKTQNKTISPISGISIIQNNESSVAETSKSHKSPKYPYPIKCKEKLEEKSISKIQKKIKKRGLEISKDGEKFYGYMQKTIKESNQRTSEQLKIMKSLLKENQKELMETEWKIKIDKELNVTPRIEVNKDSKTYTRIPKKNLSPTKIENEDSNFDFNDMPFENIDCNVVEYSNDNLIDQKDISIVIQSNIGVDDTNLETNEESYKNLVEVNSNKRNSIPEEITVKAIMEVEDNKPIVVTEELSETKPLKKSFKQLDIRNCFQKTFKKKIPPPDLSIKSSNLEVKEKIIENSNQEDEEIITKFVSNIFSRCEALEAQNDQNEPSSPLDEIITKFVYDIFTKIESLEAVDNKTAEKFQVRRSRRITEGKLSVEDISAVEQSLVDLGMLDKTTNSFNASEDMIVEEYLKDDVSKVDVADKNSDKISLEETNVDKEEFLPIKDKKVLKIDESTVKFVSKDEIQKRLSRKVNISEEAISRAGGSVKSDKITEKIQNEDTKIYKKDSGIVLSSESFNEDEEIVKNLNVSEKENETKSSTRSLRNKSFIDEPEKKFKRITRKSENNESDSNAEMKQKLSPKRVLRKSTSKEKFISLPIKESNKKTAMRNSGCSSEMRSLETGTENSEIPETISTATSTRSLRKSVVSENNELIVSIVPDNKSEEVDKNDCSNKHSKKFQRKPIIPVKSSRSLRNSVISVPVEQILEVPSQNVENTEILVEEPVVTEKLEEVKEQILCVVPDSKSESSKSSKRTARKSITPEKSLRTLRKSKNFVPVEDSLKVARPNALEPDITKIPIPDSEEQESENITGNLETLPTEVPVNSLKEEVIKKNPKRVSRKPIIPSKSSRSLRQSVSSIPNEGISVDEDEIAPIAVATGPDKINEEKIKPLKRIARKPIITEKSSRSLRKSSSVPSEINLEELDLPIALQELEVSVDSDSHGKTLGELKVSASAVNQELLPQQEENFSVSEIQKTIFKPEMSEIEISKSSQESSAGKKKSFKKISRKPIIPVLNTRSLRKTEVPIPKKINLEAEIPIPEAKTRELLTNEIILQISSKTDPMSSSESLKIGNADISSRIESSTLDLVVDISEIQKKVEDDLITESVTKSSKRNTRKAIIPEKTLRTLRKSGIDISKEIPESEKKTEISEDSNSENTIKSSIIEEKETKSLIHENVPEVIETPSANDSVQNEELSSTKKPTKKTGKKKQIAKEIKDETEDIPLAQLTPTTSKRNSRKSKIVYNDNSVESETKVCTPKTGKRRTRKDDSVIDQSKRVRRATRLSTASSISDSRRDDDPENDEEFNGFVEGDEKSVVKIHGKRGRSLSSVKDENVEEVPKKKRAYNKKLTKTVLETENLNETKKRERTSGNDDLNESKKQKTSHIVCGKCMETIPRVSWKRHLLGHNGIGWIVGEEPDWDLNEKNLILSRMLAFMRECGLSFVTCEKCGDTRKSALGLITHQEECGLDAEALEKKKISCEYCGSRLKAYCLSIHLQNHCYELKRREREAKELQEEKDAEERKVNESVLVTKSGRIKRRSVLKAENQIKSTNLSEAKNLCEDYIGVFQRKKITGGCTRRWAAQIRENETAKCLNEKCLFTGKTVDDLLVHSKSCNFTDNSSGYICLICKIRDSTRELIKSHIEEIHGNVNEKNIAMDYEASDSEADIGDDSSESDDDESGDEEIDEEEAVPEDDNFEEDDEEPKSRKQKLYTVPPNILENLEESKTMMVDYKTMLVNGKRTPFFSFAIDWTKNFRKLHYTIEPLYREMAIQQFKILTSEESIDFLPLVKKSPNFYAKISDKYRSKYCNTKPPPEWLNLETFQGISLGGVPTFYCGGPVTAMDWVPFPNSYKGPEVLAVVVKNDIHNATAIFELQPEKCIIQIWDIPDVTNTVLRISSTPQMRYAICFPYGPVWQIKFCPSGGYFDDGTSESRLGLLAVTSLIGDVYLYALPIQVNLTDEENKTFSILSLKPSAVLTYDLNKYKLIGEKSQQMTKITWSEAQGHSVFAAGYSSGMICVWKIDTKSILLLQRINDVKTFLPIQIIKAHNNCISALSIFYVDNSRYMMTGCKDRSSKFYDIQSVPVELTCSQLKSRITCGIWPLHWPGFFLSVDEGYALHRAGTSYVQPLDIGSKQTSMHILNSTGCDMDFNDWLNSFVVVTDNGDIVGGYCKQLLFTFSEKDARKYRFIFGCTEVVELKNTQNPILNSESSYPDKYGLIFCDILDPINSKQCTVDLLNTRRPPIEEYPLTQINQVRCNRNADAYKFYALGYQAGFVRIRSLRQVK